MYSRNAAATCTEFLDRHQVTQDFQLRIWFYTPIFPSSRASFTHEPWMGHGLLPASPSTLCSSSKFGKTLTKPLILRARLSHRWDSLRV